MFRCPHAQPGKRLLLCSRARLHCRAVSAFFDVVRNSSLALPVGSELCLLFFLGRDVRPSQSLSSEALFSHAYGSVDVGVGAKRQGPASASRARGPTAASALEGGGERGCVGIGA